MAATEPLRNPADLTTAAVTCTSHLAPRTAETVGTNERESINMNKRAIGAVVAVGALALSLAACSSPASGSAVTGSASASMPTVTMMVGGIDKQIYLPYQLAQNLGYYKKYGVKVELSTEQNGGVGAEDAMASGQVDMAGAWYIHTVDFQSKGKDVINLVQLSGAPGERVMCGTKSGVHSAADFKGKTIGVTDLGSGTDELAQFLASQHGISKADYHTLAVGAGSTAIAAIQRGSADCVVTTQPTVGALTTQKLAYTAVDLATQAGAKKALGGDWPAAGLLARADWVKAHQDAAQKVVDALVATMHWINTHSAADIAGKLPADFVQNNTITKAQYVAGLTTDKGQFLPDGIMPAGGPKVIFAMEKTLGVDTSNITISGTFTNKYAQAANKRAGFKVTTKPAGANG
jgi:NitT/TauT family transport system substrate-binding protein